jgi:hypothetical protein
MYFLEGGLLVVTNLLKTDAWIRDTERSHCNVCVQQFMPFRRRHHCRTCGEVVCGNCSAQRKIHLTEVNVECATRVCSFCMIRATDAVISATANEAALRESVALFHSQQTVQKNQQFSVAARTPPHDALAATPAAAAVVAASLPPVHARGRPQQHPHPSSPTPGAPSRPQPSSGRHRVSKQLSMLSLESELTDGSVVQLWPPPVDESARLEVARRASIRASERDPTMSLLVSIVARTLACPVAFIGILDDHSLWFKATVGWSKSHIPRDECVCAVQQKTMVVADTNLDKHFHANTLALGDNNSSPMRYYAGAPIIVLGQCIGAVSAIDSVPHWETSASMTSTLEAVANIVSEVLEQRIDPSQKSNAANTSNAVSADDSDSLAIAQWQVNPVQQHPQPVRLNAVPSEERKSHTNDQPAFSLASTVSIPSPIKSSYNSSEDTLTLVDLQAVVCSSESSLSSDDFSDDESDGLSDDDHPVINELSGRRASETAPSPPTLVSSNTADSSSPVHPWPPRTSIMVDRMSCIGDNLLAPTPTSYTCDNVGFGLPRFSLAVPVGSPETNEKISKAMEFFQALQSSRWSPCYHGRGRDDDIVSFEMLSQGRHFTKSHAKLVGDCTHVIARLQTYDDRRIYADLIDTVCERREKLNVQTWVDRVQLRPGFEASHYGDVQVLSHWRQYPDGSNFIIAYNDSNTDLIMIEDFLFGWFIAPSGLDATGRCCVSVSSLVAEPVAAVINENQNHHDQFNLSKRLLKGLQQSLPFHYNLGAMASVVSDQSLSSPSSSSTSSFFSDNQLGGFESSFAALVAPSPTTDVMAIAGMRSRTCSSNASEKMVAIRTKYSEPSSLNDNERMMLDLLDKTISTQEVLAAQQHVMANVMDYHGTQLQRISSAIDRVENILHTNGDKLKQLHLVRPQSPPQHPSPVRDRSGRQSISL